MKQPEKYDDNIPAEVSDANKQRRIERLDKAIKYYGSKLNVVNVIMSIVYGAVELSYGIQYNGQCPIQPMIAIFLIVHGAVLLFDGVIGFLGFLTSHVVYIRFDQVVARRLIFVLFLIVVLINLFCFAWFIAGNVWVFGAAANGYQGSNSTLTTYCQSKLFSTAEGTIISKYIIFGVIIIVIIFHKQHDIMGHCQKQKTPSNVDTVQM
jgi:hypothetical protein